MNISKNYTENLQLRSIKHIISRSIFIIDLLASTGELDNESSELAELVNCELSKYIKSISCNEKHVNSNEELKEFITEYNLLKAETGTTTGANKAFNKVTIEMLNLVMELESVKSLHKLLTPLKQD